MGPIGRMKFGLMSLAIWLSGFGFFSYYFYGKWIPRNIDFLKRAIGTRHVTDIGALKWAATRGFHSSDPETATIAASLILVGVIVGVLCFILYSIVSYKRIKGLTDGQFELKKFAGLTGVYVMNFFLSKSLLVLYSVIVFLALISLKTLPVRNKATKEDL